MKRKKINRPHWKRIALDARRKLNEARRDARNGLSASKAEKAYEASLETPRKMTKAQQKWHMEGFMSAQKSAQQEMTALRKENDRLFDKREQRQQRHELLKPALELIQKLMED